MLGILGTIGLGAWGFFWAVGQVNRWKTQVMYPDHSRSEAALLRFQTNSILSAVNYQPPSTPITPSIDLARAHADLMIAQARRDADLAIAMSRRRF